MSSVICLICHSICTSENHIIALSCGHVYHFDCLISFRNNNVNFDRNWSNECPYCRQRDTYTVRLFINFGTDPLADPSQIEQPVGPRVGQQNVNYENYGDRDSPDQIVPSKRLFTFSSTHSLLSKEVSSTTSSSSIDTPILSPQLPTIREHEIKRTDFLSENKLIAAICKIFKCRNLPILFVKNVGFKEK